MTNSQAATHESWLVRSSPHAPGFSRSNQGEEFRSMISHITYYYLFEWIDSKALTVCYINDSVNLITGFTVP